MISKLTSPLTDYRNFDLLISRAGRQYRAFVVDAPAGEASILFDLPFAAHELTQPGGPAGKGRYIGLSSDPGQVLDLSDLGRQLFEAIFRDKIHSLLVTSLSSMAHQGAGLRLRLRFEEDAADLANLPWEILYDPAQDHFLGLDEQSPIVRYLLLARSRSTLLVEPPLRVLAVLSSPASLAPLDMAREWQAIQASLSGLVADGKFLLERLEPPSLVALQNRLLGEPVHILHFAGHGVFDETSQAGSLALEHESGGHHLVQGEQLAAILRNHPSVRLAYLNACKGALASGQSVFTGVAQSLVQGGVLAAIAMQAEITDSGSIDLTRAFYTALAAGRPVDAALTQARVALNATDSPEWAIPVLFSRSPDNRLFDIRALLPKPECPYPGMVPFAEAQKEFFYGRDSEIEDAMERLRQHPFLAVVGPSGSGKSSLIYAGVIPQLRQSRRFGPGEWTIHIVRPSDSRTQEGDAAPTEALAQLLGCKPDELPAQAFEHRTLLFVDQFEEVFTLAKTEEAQAFLDVLQSLIGRPNLYILLTVRADLYPDLMASSLWQPIRANRLELMPLGDDELWMAIVEPAARVGVTVAEALAVQLIADTAGESGMLPLVQETLVLLWDKVERQQLGLDAYRQMAEGGRSGLEVAIDRRASVVYENLPDAARPIARRIFLRLIQFGEGRADTRRQQTVGELRASGDDPGLFDETLVTLTNNRLLTTSGEAQEKEGAHSLSATRRVDLAHEALIAGWPRLQVWLGQRRVAERTRRRLEEKATEWLRLEKSGGLLDAYEVQEAETWLKGDYAQDLGYSRDLLDLVTASQDALAQAEAEREAQRQHELEQAQKLAEEQRLRAEEGEKSTRELRRRLILAVIIGLIAVAAAGAAVWFGVDASKQRDRTQIAMVTATVAQGQAEIEAQNAVEAEETAVAERVRAETQAQLALSRQLAAQAISFAGQQPDLSMLLSLEALDLMTASEDRKDLLVNLVYSPFLSRFLHGHIAPVYVVAYSPDGHTLASGDEEGNIILWDLSTGRPRGPSLTGHRGYVSHLAFSPDGQILASGVDRTVTLWDVATSDVLGSPLETLTRPVMSLAFSSDGGTLVVGSAKDLWLWNVASGQPPVKPAAEFGGPIRAISPDDRTLALVSRYGVRFADIETAEHLTEALEGHSNQIHGLAFSSDGRRLATASYDESVIVWDVAGRLPAGEPPQDDSSAGGATSGSQDDLPRDMTLLGHDGRVLAVAFSPDGRTLASGSTDNTIILWDVATGGSIGEPLHGHNNWVRSLAFSPDGQTLASSSADGTIILWDMTGRRFLQGHTEEVRSVAFSPDGQTLASSGFDNTAILWDATTGEPLGPPLEGHSKDVSGVAFSSDSQTLATFGQDGRVLLWDVETRQQYEPALLGHASAVIDGAFSPDGRLLASGDWGGTIIVWELPDLLTFDGSTAAQPVSYRLVGHSNQVIGIAFSPNSQILASGSGDGTIVLWDVASHEPLGPPLTGHENWVTSVAFSPDGQTLVSGSSDKSIILWDVASRQPVRPPLTGHAAQVWKVVFDPASNGQSLISGGGDGTILQWDMVTGEPQGPPIVGEFEMEGLAVHPSGQTLATGNYSGSAVIIWQLDQADWLTRACSIANRNLTQAEWEEYIGLDLVYRQTCPDLPLHPSVPASSAEETP
jgi:WD40 repeat protein